MSHSTLLKSISVGTNTLRKTATLSKHGSVATPTKARPNLCPDGGLQLAVLQPHCLQKDGQLTVRIVPQVVRALTGFAPKHSKHASLDSAVDLSFRLYKHESGAMNRVSVDEQALERAFSQDNDMVWEAVQSPRIGAVNK